jgi:hypothetical protein
MTMPMSPAGYGVSQIPGLYRKVQGASPMSAMGAAKARLGSGARFSALKSKLASRPGVHNPGALAAYIGRKRYGEKKFHELSEGGKREEGGSGY